MTSDDDADDYDEQDELDEEEEEEDDPRSTGSWWQWTKTNQTASQLWGLDDDGDHASAAEAEVDDDNAEQDDDDDDDDDTYFHYIYANNNIHHEYDDQTQQDQSSSGGNNNNNNNNYQLMPAQDVSVDAVVTSVFFNSIILIVLMTSYEILRRLFPAVYSSKQKQTHHGKTTLAIHRTKKNKKRGWMHKSYNKQKKKSSSSSSQRNRRQQQQQDFRRKYRDEGSSMDRLDEHTERRDDLDCGIVPGQSTMGVVPVVVDQKHGEGGGGGGGSASLSSSASSSTNGGSAAGAAVAGMKKDDTGAKEHDDDDRPGSGGYQKHRRSQSLEGLPIEPLSWVVPVLGESWKHVRQHAGLDGYFFLRYIRMNLRITAVTTVWFFLIVVPIYYTGSNKADGWYHISAANVRVTSWRMWTPVFAAYWFTSFIIFVINQEYKHYLDLRQHFLAQGNEHVIPQHHYSLLVENIPYELRSDIALADYFEKLFPGKVHSASVVLKLPDLYEVSSRCLRICRRLEKSIAHLHATNNRPTHIVGRALLNILGVDFDPCSTLTSCCCCCCKFICCCSATARGHDRFGRNNANNNIVYVDDSDGNLMDEEDHEQQLKYHHDDDSSNGINKKMPAVPSSNRRGTVVDRAPRGTHVDSISYYTSELAHNSKTLFEMQQIKAQIAECGNQSNKTADSWFSLQHNMFIRYSNRVANRILEESALDNDLISPTDTFEASIADLSIGDITNENNMEHVRQYQQQQQQYYQNYQYELDAIPQAEQMKSQYGSFSNPFTPPPPRFSTGSMSVSPATMSRKQMMQHQRYRPGSGGSAGASSGGASAAAAVHVAGSSSSSGTMTTVAGGANASRRHHHRTAAAAKTTTFEDHHRSFQLLEEDDEHQEQQQQQKQHRNSQASSMDDGIVAPFSTNSYTSTIRRWAGRLGLDFGVAVLKVMNKQIDVTLEGIVGSTMSSTGFVTFLDLSSTACAASAPLSAKYGVLDVCVAPEPSEIMWRNAHISKRSRERRETVVNFILFLGVILWSFPLLAIQIFAKAEFLAQIPGLEWILTFHGGRITHLVNGYLPVVALLGLICLLPVIFEYIAVHYERRKTFTDIQSSMLTRYFYYQLANIYISVTAGSLLKSMADIIARPSKVLEFLGDSLPTMVGYFIALLVTKIMAGLPIVFLRLGALSKMLFFRIMTGGDEKYLTQRELDTIYRLENVQYGWEFPSQLLVVVIVYTYAIICPVILPFGILFFLFALLVYKKQLLYVYSPVYESGGTMFPKAVRHTLFGLVCGQLTLIGYMVTRGCYYQPLALLPLPAWTCYIMNQFHKSYAKPSGRLSLERARECDRLSTSRARHKQQQQAAAAAAQPPPPPPGSSRGSPSLSSVGTTTISGSSTDGGGGGGTTTSQSQFASSDPGIEARRQEFDVTSYRQPVLTELATEPWMYRRGEIDIETVTVRDRLRKRHRNAVLHHTGLSATATEASSRGEGSIVFDFDDSDDRRCRPGGGVSA